MVDWGEVCSGSGSEDVCVMQVLASGVVGQHTANSSRGNVVDAAAGEGLCWALAAARHGGE